jgi:MFS family permease
MDGDSAAGRLRDRFGALSEREFRLLWIGQSVSGLGDAMALVALAFAVLERTGRAADLGFLMTAWVVSRTALTLVGGVLADRMSRQSVMIGADLLRAITQGLVAALLLSGQARIWQLAVLTVLYGGAEAFFNPAQTGLIPATVTPGRLQQANALIGLARNTVALAGPAAAGLIVAALGAGWVFAVDSASFLVSAAFLARLRVPAMQQSVEGSRLLSELREGWREVASRSWVWATICYFAVMNMATTAIFVLGPLVAQQSLGGAEAWGLIGTCAAAGSIAGGLAAVRLHPRRPLLAGTVALATIGMEPILLAGPAPAALIAASAFVGFAGVSFDAALWYTALQEHVPERSISRVSAYDWMGSFLFQPIGFALVGPLAARIGVGQVLWLSAGMVLASSLAVVLVPGVRRLGRTKVAASAAPAGSA